MSDSSIDFISLTADVTSAFVSNNNVASAEVPALIRSIHDALTAATRPPEPVAPAAEPAVPVRSSVKNDYIVCLEDGKKLKMLKRHLRTTYDMSPEQYRAKWNLPRDYPMVAPAYAETRKALALKIGLGRKPAAAAEKAASPAKAATPAGRKKLGIAAAKAAAVAHLGGEAKQPENA